MNLALIICTVLLPPLGVFIHEGLSKGFLINILLTLLGYFPGLVHGLWLISNHHADPPAV